MLFSLGKGHSLEKLKGLEMWRLSLIGSTRQTGFYTAQQLTIRLGMHTHIKAGPGNPGGGNREFQTFSEPKAKVRVLRGKFLTAIQWLHRFDLMHIQ